MLRFPRVRSRSGGYLDMTPLVDIMLALVLFLVLSGAAAFSTAGVAIEVPAVANAAPVPGGAYDVQILKDDRLVAGGRAVTFEVLEGELKKWGRAGRPVLITGDRAASLGRTLEVWDACRAAGVRELHVRTRVEKPR